MLIVVVGDSACDIAIDVEDTTQYIVWAVGGIEETAFKHFVTGRSKICTYFMNIYMQAHVSLCRYIVSSS